MSEIALLRGLFDAAVAVAMPDVCLPDHLPDPPRGRTLVVGAGKASAAMAATLENHWTGPLSGLVITRYGHSVPCKKIEIVEAAHPVPDEKGTKAAAHILELAGELGQDDLLIALISGGGSALLSVPGVGLELADKQTINQLLLSSGVAISEMNVVRKHLSAIKGGRLASAAWPARTCGLLISDVPGDDPATIASGPTVGDASTLADARKILRAIAKPLPGAVNDALQASENESPKPGDERLGFAENIVISTPMMALKAAAKLAEENGMQAIILGDDLQGDARDLGCSMAQQALAVPRSDKPVVLLSGGETTVTMTGSGVGGRNVEYLMGLAVGLNGAPNIYALACDTDGIDGGAEIAGAYITPSSLKRAETIGYLFETALENNDGHGLFERLDNQVITGPTLTNVNDFRAILILPEN